MSRRNVRESALKRRPAVAAALLSVLVCLGVAGRARAQATAKPKPPGIRHIEIVHFSHTDYGFTDHPDVCRELQRRFLDVALDTALATRDRPPEGDWLWVSRDAPLVTFGGQQVLARRRDAPKDTHRVLAMVFNNFWYTNFVGDQHGVMEFSFDLARHKKLDAPAERAQALVAEPPVLIQPSPAEDPVLIRRVYRP